MTEVGIALSEFVAIPDLQMTTVAGHRGLDRMVRSVHTVYDKDLLFYVAPDTLCLTLDGRPVSLAHDGVEFVRRLDELNMAGLGLGLYGALGPVPENVRAEAERRRFPIVTIAAEVSFQTVIGTVLRQLASSNLYEMKRMVAAHDALLNLCEEEPAPAILGRLSSILDAAFLLLDQHGKLVVVYGESSEQRRVSDAVGELWARYQEGACADRTDGVLESSLGTVLYRELRVHGVLRELLLVVGAATRQSQVFLDNLLGFAQHLLQLDLLARTQADSNRRDERRRLLQSLVVGGSGCEDLEERLRYLGFGESFAMHAVVLSAGIVSQSVFPRTGGGDGPRSALPPEVLDAAERFLELRKAAFLCGTLGDDVAVLIGADQAGQDRTSDELRSLVSDLTRSLTQEFSNLRLAAGCSYPVTRMAQVGSAMSEGLLAAGRAADVIGDVVVFCDGLGPELWLLHKLATEDLEALEAMVLGALQTGDAHEDERNAKALRAFVANNCSVADTAAALYMHRNTMRRRLDQLQELIGLDFHSVADVSQVRLALQAGELLASRRLLAGALSR